MHACLLFSSTSHAGICVACLKLTTLGGRIVDFITHGSYTDDIIILLNFISTDLHGYEITPSLGGGIVLITQNFDPA